MSGGVGREAGGPAERLEVWAPDGIGEVRPGDDLARVVGDALADEGGVLDGDVVVVTSKVVSKAEGRVVAAADREQAITDETVRVVATRAHEAGTLRIVQNRLGLVMAAAGVDSSNAADGTVLLLPEDPDASARGLRAALQDRFGVRLAVVITDTAGRPWREGLVDIAIGAAGLAVLEDLRGQVDAHGRPLTATVTAVADEVASAAELVRGKIAGRPVAVVRGLDRYVTEGLGARALIRAAEDDLFRLGAAEAWRDGFEAGRAGGAGDESPRDGVVGDEGVGDEIAGDREGGWGVVVPVKRLGRAKSRLDVAAGGAGGPVAARVRERLALAFALDTVDAARAAHQVSTVVVVTSEPRVVTVLAGRQGVDVVPDPGTGLNGALRAGISALASRHHGPAAVLLGDLPALRAADLDDALARARSHDLGVVPDAAGSGTVLLTARDPTRLVPRFGVGSRVAHEAAGHHVLPVGDAVGLRRDVDSPEDLGVAVRLGVGPATADALIRVACDAGVPTAG